MVQPFVMIVYGNREHALGVTLADDIVVENVADFRRRGNTVARLHQRALVLLADDVHAQLDAFIADEHGRARDQLTDLVLALAAEGTVQGVLGIVSARFAHTTLPGRC